MRNKMGIETKLEELKDRSWLYYEDEQGEPVFISDDDPDTIDNAAKKWNISPEAVMGLSDSLNNVVECIVRTAIEDLEDVWSMARCAHENALTAMAILSDDNGDESIEPNDEDCKNCEWYDKDSHTCHQPPDAEPE
jgi:hypothetical protein